MYVAVLCACALGLAVEGGEARTSEKAGQSRPSSWWERLADLAPTWDVQDQRMQRFWRDYYDALSRYYRQLGSIDWVGYYKNRNYPISPSLPSPSLPQQQAVC